MLSMIDICMDGTHKKYDLNSYGKEVVSFGRSSECDIQIPKNYISRVHGCFYLENGEWFIKDMESTNGIYFNSNKIGALRMAVGTVKIAKNTSSQDFVTISMPLVGYNQNSDFGQAAASAYQAPQGSMQQLQRQPQYQQPQMQQYQQPQIQQYQPQRQMNQYANGRAGMSQGASSGMGLKITMIIVSSLLLVSCFFPFFGAGGGWDGYIDKYTSRNLFSSKIMIFGILIVVNSLLLIANGIFNRVYGLNITALIFAIFCPIITIIALVVVKGATFGLLKASWGFYVVLLLGIASIVLAAINISQTSKARKASMMGYGR